MYQIRREKRTTISEVIVRTVSFSVVFLFFLPHLRTLALREKVGKLSSFWDWWAEPLFVSIIVAKYILFPRANNGRSCEKKFLAKRFSHAISVHYRDFEHAYVY